MVNRGQQENGLPAPAESARRSTLAVPTAALHPAEKREQAEGEESQRHRGEQELSDGPVQDHPRRAGQALRLLWVEGQRRVAEQDPDHAGLFPSRCTRPANRAGPLAGGRGHRREVDHRR